MGKIQNLVTGVRGIQDFSKLFTLMRRHDVKRQFGCTSILFISALDTLVAYVPSFLASRQLQKQLEKQEDGDELELGKLGLSSSADSQAWVRIQTWPGSSGLRLI